MSDAAFYPNVDREIGRRVREGRQALGMSQDALAEAMTTAGFGFHVTTIGKIERGERKVTLGEAGALASALSQSVEMLMNGNTPFYWASKGLFDAQAPLEKAATLYRDAQFRFALAIDADTGLSSGERDLAIESLLAMSPEQVVKDSAWVSKETYVALKRAELGGDAVRALLGENFDQMRRAVEQDG
jgi:transcriptional regulator with XRE-family HTH domain